MIPRFVRSTNVFKSFCFLIAEKFVVDLRFWNFFLYQLVFEFCRHDGWAADEELMFLQSFIGMFFNQLCGDVAFFAGVVGLIADYGYHFDIV